MKDFLLSAGNDIFHHKQNCWLKPSTMSKGWRKLQRLWRDCGNTAPVLAAMLGRLYLNSKILLGNINWFVREFEDSKIQILYCWKI